MLPQDYNYTTTSAFGSTNADASNSATSSNCTQGSAK
jgi:hypothetical protein